LEQKARDENLVVINNLIVDDLARNHKSKLTQTTTTILIDKITEKTAYIVLKGDLKISNLRENEYYNKIKFLNDNNIQTVTFNPKYLSKIQTNKKMVELDKIF